MREEQKIIKSNTVGLNVKKYLIQPGIKMKRMGFYLTLKCYKKKYHQVC